MIPDEIRAKYPNLASALTGLLGSEEAKVASDTKPQVSLELASLLTSSDSLEMVVRTLFPQKPRAEDVLKFGIVSYQRFGAGEEVRRFVGIVWSQAMSAWNRKERKQFLELTVSDPHKIFFALDFMAEMLAHVDLTAAEALPWILKAHTVVSRDLMQRGLWMSVQAFCRRSPSEAISVIETWLTRSPDDVACKALATMVGYVRSVISPKDRAAEKFETLEQLLRTSHPTWRAIWIRSWAENSPSINEETALAIRGANFPAGSEEQSAWIYLVCAVARENRHAWPWTIRELRINASTDLQSEPKFWITITALQGIETGENVSSSEWQQLLGAIMPIGADEDAVWQRIEHHLANQADKNPEAVRSLLNDIGRRSGKTFLRQLRARKLSYLTSVLSNKGAHHPICSDLCFARFAHARQLGLFLFAECGADRLDEIAVNNASSVQLELLLLEAQRTMIDYAALARLHACLAPRVDQLGGELLFVLYDEVAIQGLNTHAYRDALAREASDNEYIKAILKDVHERLAETGKASNSSVLQMDVPYRNSAEILSRQRMVRDVGKGIKKYSTFLNLIRKVTLIYCGQTWRTFMPDGSLGESSNMHMSSATVEVPRMEFLDIEGMHLRRLNASMRIAKLEADAPSNGER